MTYRLVDHIIIYSKLKAAHAHIKTAFQGPRMNVWSISHGKQQQTTELTTVPLGHNMLLVWMG